MNKSKTKKETKHKMIRRKPTNKANIVGPVYDAPVHDVVGDYIESKPQNKYFIKPTNSDSAGDSIELMYLHNVKEHEALVSMQRKFLKMRTEHEDKLNENRTKSINKKQEELRHQFVKVSDFIKDCEDKERAAKLTCNEQLQKSEEVERQNAEARESIDVLKVFRDELKETIDKYKPYMQILEEVVNKSKTYGSIKDCMDHCDAIMIAQTEIDKLQKIKLTEIDQMRKAMGKMSDEVALSVIGMKNELALLERDYDEARSKWSLWGSKKGNAKDVIMKMDFEKTQSLHELRVIYGMLRKHSGEVETFNHDTEAMCDYIYSEYEILKETSKILGEDSTNE